MELTKEEAISLVLSCSAEEKISGKVKLNKLLARLNYFMIPADIDFSLNKFGSFNAEVTPKKTKFYEPYTYNYHGEQTGLTITNLGKSLAHDVINKKLSKIMSQEEIEEFKKEISHLSTLRANEIADDEHKKLFVDEEDKHKLEQRINVVYIDLLDLYEEIKNKEITTTQELDLYALIEYSFYLAKYLKEKRFKNIEGYNYDAYMPYYYFLELFEKKMIPFLKKEQKNKEQINRFYQYIVNYSKGKVPFSLANKDLKELIV